MYVIISKYLNFILSTIYMYNASVTNYNTHVCMLMDTGVRGQGPNSSAG